MERLDLTRAEATKIWWAFMWRALLGFILTGAFAGAGFGFIGHFLGLDPLSLVNVASLVGLLLGVLVSFEVFFRVLKKRFRDFEIAIIARES
jgi:cation transporter-like permease